MIPHQHDAPIIIGFPPVLMSWITLLFNPMAAIAIIIINFDNSLIGWNTSALTPICMQSVVMAADGKQTVKAYLAEVSKEVGATVALKSFVRFETGEGLEKKEENFAEEVAKQMK